jgi:hypothetical protein
VVLPRTGKGGKAVIYTKIHPQLKAELESSLVFFFVLDYNFLAMGRGWPQLDDKCNKVNTNISN